ncbi:MAG: PAS domain-containing sensor histidine kinase, partial [Pseudomonas bubulae]
MPIALLPHDPQPSVVLDRDGLALAANDALIRLLAGKALSQARALLPGNLPELVRACLKQGRAIEQVEAQSAQQVWLWTLIPDPDSQCVLARGREASTELLAGREAAKARRLYRLITENTTDLISRHTPDGRFLDASPASWTLLGY